MDNRKYQLINVDHHGNGIALFKCWDSRMKYFIKLAISERGNFGVKNERIGYQWFFSRIGTENTTSFSNNYYYEIQIPEFSGRNFISEAYVRGNEKVIENLIQLYKDLWKIDEKEFFMHGDLVLSNVIVGEENIYLIDWEHSHKAEKIYWGYDIIHLLFVAIHYSPNGIRSTDKKFLKNCYRSLCEEATLGNLLLEKPFQNAYKYMRDYQSRFSLNEPVNSKFILSQSNIRELEALDLMIT